MTFRPERLFASLLLGAAALAAPLAAAPGDAALAEAEAALAREDGVAAELAGKRALEEGAARADVAALVGEGELLQGDLADARSWLGDAAFSDATRTRGLSALARLQMAEGDYAAAIATYDLMVSEGRESAALWVDIGRMRYRLGLHHQALEAARRAVELDGSDPRALEFEAQLVRDAEGVVPSLALFRRALEAAPTDKALMQQYAATLGDAGEYRRMLHAVRALVKEHGNDPFAFYLQAVMAARAGQDDLAQRLWWRTEGQFDGNAAGLIVNGVLEYRSGNPAVAVELFDSLRRMQPMSDAALLLYARALVANDEANAALAVLEPHAQRPDASPYMLVLAARAHEQLGNRARAGDYLDRASFAAAQPGRAMPAFLPRDSAGRMADPDNPLLQLREMLNEGDLPAARAMVERLNAQYAGSADLQMLAGDVHLLAGSRASAMAYYRAAAQIRRDWPLVQRMVALQDSAPAQAREVLANYLAGNPRQQAAAALLGRMHRDAGNPARATALLRHAASLGAGGRDALLLADLAQMEAALGNGEAALSRANEAHRLWRGNRNVARVFGRIREMQGDTGAGTGALLAKAQGTGLSPAP
ncbi:tetratricopeptide repeat protein [Alteraurantiacibacter palmitatis]|uniref:Tetratricopeptide repeat protein n=1 Tax=Alteraurantiacibacter palmitatis TaxID=2054628 RepID=A0ABV7E4M8_9SPHN